MAKRKGDTTTDPTDAAPVVATVAIADIVAALPPPTPGRMFMLRTCNADMTSYHGFRWPMSGHVVARDWSPEDRCGYGLHGLPWGMGNGSLLDLGEGKPVVVFEADESAVVHISADGGGKSKAPEGWVLYVGDLATAARPRAVTAARPRAATAARPRAATAARPRAATAARPRAATAAQSRFCIGTKCAISIAA